ncbi:MAG TPA: ATP-binding protein [Steroidobacteraceae bacterium]|nr:ATP-binding protein [Steroidobacteraceae bacterium]
MRTNPPQAQGRLIASILASSGVLIVAAFVAARFASDPTQADYLDDVHWTIGYLVGALLGWMGYARANDKNRNARRWFALGLTASALGQISWDIQELLRWYPYPAPSDLLFLLFGPCCAYGLLCTVRDQRGPLTLDFILDVAMFVIAILAITLALYLPQAPVGPAAVAVLVAYPCTMLIAPCVMLVMAPTLKVLPRLTSLMFPLALLVNAAMWMQWIYFAQQDVLLQNTWLYLVFSLVVVLLGYGAYCWDVESSTDPAWERRCEAILRMMPLVAVKGAAISIGLAWWLPNISHGISLLIYASAAVVLALAVTRQSLLLLEHDRRVAAEKQVREGEEARARLEAQLRQSQKLEAIGTLASGIAHDFNNLLSAILGNVELAVHDTEPASPARTSLGEIRKAGLRARDLIRRIVAFARPQEANTRPLQLAAIVEEALQLVRVTLPATVKVKADLHIEAPPVMVDSAQIEQVVFNLCTNAYQAMPNHVGCIDVSLSVRDVDATAAAPDAALRAGRYVCLRVADTGVGMSPETVHRIFEPFFTTKPSGEGSGLGLSIVHGIVRAHGGVINVESAPGRGTSFHVFLPADTRAQAPEPAPEPVAMQCERGADQHILYIDDEEALVFLMQRLLERRGYQVSGFTDPAAAMEVFMADDARFDLVITDQSMPGRSGTDLARQMLAARPGTRIVLVSGYLRPEQIEAAKSIGIQEVVLKPNTVDELVATVHRLVSQEVETLKLEAAENVAT